MLFGVFDKLHGGHLSLFNQARKFGKLYVIVTRDAVAFELKGHKPSETEGKRVANIKKLKMAEKVILGDKLQGTYGVVKKYRPDMVCLGYDQKMLKKDMRIKIKGKLLPEFQLKILRPYKIGKYHTSLL